jgi:hypothetical protein
MRALLAVGLMLAASGCDKPGNPGAAPPTKPAAGTLVVEPDGGAGARVDVDGCWSGARLFFRGVELFHEPDVSRRIRLVDDPVGGFRVVLLHVVPSKPRVVVDPATCSSFDARITGMPAWLNDVQQLQGTLHMTCSVPDAGRVTATIDFTDCSFDNRTGVE